MTKAGESIICGAKEALDYAKQEKQDSMINRTEEWWDKWFLGLAKYISTASKDPSCQFGAAIIRPDKTVCSVGYNGLPRKMKDYDNYLLDRKEKYSRILHAEINSILNSKDNLIEGYSLYIYPFLSCDRCTSSIIQAGIVRVVSYYLEPGPWFDRWESNLCIARGYYKECGVEVKEYKK